MLEELLDLLELFDRLINAGHIFERDFRGVLRDLFGLGFPELHDTVPAALELKHDEYEQPEEQQVRENVAQEPLEQRWLLRVGDGFDITR